MFANMSKLKGKIVEKNKTQEGVADEIGMDRSTFYRKMKSAKFTIGEVHRICDVLPLTQSEATEIFLSQ